MLDKQDDYFGGFVTSRVDFNGEKYFEKDLFLNYLFSVSRT